MKITEEYLNKLNESGAAYLIVTTVMKLIFLIIHRIVLKVKTKKREYELENKLYSVTQKKYNVFSFKDDVPNAFVFEWFKSNIYLTSGLLKMMNERELIAIMIHETSHIINHDLVKRNSIEFGGSTFLIMIFGSLERLAIKSRNPNIGLGVMQLTFIAAIVLTIFMMSWTVKHYRKQETAADVSVVKYGYSKDLISAFKKFDVYKKKELKDFAKKNPNIDVKRLDDEFKRLDEHPEHKDRIKKLLEEEKLYAAMAKGNLVEVKNIIKSYLIAA